MNLRPLHDQVLIRRSEADSVSKGGIIIPENAKQQSHYGKVVASGPGKTLDNGKLVPLDFNVGDVVYFRAYTGQEVEIEGEKLIMLRGDAIEAVQV
jgi:chaperonin GroES